MQTGVIGAGAAVIILAIPAVCAAVRSAQITHRSTPQIDVGFTSVGQYRLIEEDGLIVCVCRFDDQRFVAVDVAEEILDALELLGGNVGDLPTDLIAVDEACKRGMMGYLSPIGMYEYMARCSVLSWQEALAIVRRQVRDARRG